MSPRTIVEFSSRDVREKVLKKIESENSKMAEDDRNVISIGRAKTAWQLKRNNNLTKAADALKKDNRSQGKTVKIEWQLEDKANKNRVVKVDEDVVFVQLLTDQAGSFQAPYQNVIL